MRHGNADNNADVAQLVEHHLAKVDVASSNLVVRSLFFNDATTPAMPDVPAGFFRTRAIGAAVARFPDTEEVTGSIPVSPTTQQLSGAAFLLPESAGQTLNRASRP